MGNNKQYILMFFCAVAVALFTSCNDDTEEELLKPTSDIKPKIVLAAETMEVVKGDTLLINASLSHNDGVKSVQLSIPGLKINEIFEFSGKQNTLDFEHKLAVPYYNFTEGNFNLTLVATSNALTQQEATAKVVANEPSMFAIGNGFSDYPSVDWTMGREKVVPMQEIQDGVFSIKNLKVGTWAELKFVGQTDGWEGKDYGWDAKTADASGTLGNGASGVFVFEKAGVYDILFNENDLKCIVTAKEQYPPSEMYIIGNGLLTADGANFSASWAEDGSLAQPLQETTEGSGVFEITIKIDESQLNTGDGYDGNGCYFYFTLDNSWGKPYGVVGNGGNIDDWYYVTDPGLAGGNTFTLVPDLDAGWASYIYYSGYYYPGSDGTYLIVVDTNAMTCTVSKK